MPAGYYVVFGSAFALWLFLVIIKRLYLGNDIVKKPPNILISGYRLVYSDQKPDKLEKGVIYSKLLVSKKYGLKGKPDFIFQHRATGMLVPVELKSGKIREEALPHEGDLMQLVAYFLILEDLFGIRPKEGRLIYSDYMFVVKNRRHVRKKALHIVKGMRQMLCTGKGTAKASYHSCRNCLMRGTVCEYSAED